MLRPMYGHNMMLGAIPVASFMAPPDDGGDSSALPPVPMGPPSGDQYIQGPFQTPTLQTSVGVPKFLQPTSGSGSPLPQSYVQGPPPPQMGPPKSLAPKADTGFNPLDILIGIAKSAVPISNAVVAVKYPGYQNPIKPPDAALARNQKTPWATYGMALGGLAIAGFVVYLVTKDRK